MMSRTFVAIYRRDSRGPAKGSTTSGTRATRRWKKPASLDERDGPHGRAPRSPESQRQCHEVERPRPDRRQIRDVFQDRDPRLQDYVVRWVVARVRRVEVRAVHADAADAQL